MRYFVMVGCCLAAGVALSAPDLFIGSEGLGHVSPAAAWPFGMVQAGPDTSRTNAWYQGDWPHTCGYQYSDRYLWRFSQCRFYGIGCGSMGFFGLLPSATPFTHPGHAYAKEMDKATEVAEPGYYAVTLKEGTVRCEMSALAHSAAYRFSFGKGGRVYLLVDPGWGVTGGEPDRKVDLARPEAYFSRFVVDCGAQQQTATRVALHTHQVAWNEVECWGTLEFSAPIADSRVLRTARFPLGEIVEYAFDLPESGVLEARIALSRHAIRAAARNLAAEQPRFDFDGVRAKSAAEWKRRLDAIALDPSTPETVRKNFEAAFYRTMIHPSDLGDVGGAHEYSNLSLWDIFRACSPLQTIVAPEVTGGLVASMCDAFERRGYLPILETWGVENHCMVGHHAVPIIVDAYLKGIGGFDSERAYEAVKDSLTVMHVKACDGTWGLLKEDWDLWDRYGYYPFDKLTGEYHGLKVRGESVSRALECAYDDACAAKFAAALGKADDAAFFAKRARNWRNVFDASVGFARGKDSSGRWREPFDPKACGAGPWADNDFTEGNNWQYTWHVMHDVPGLVAAMGGPKAFGEKLDRLFGETSEVYGPSFVHDVSGLIGQYAHGNEPSHHVAYLYRWSDRPWKTDECVRRICETMYRPEPNGLCGNDDSGQMAAWYVFAALGFYPVDACGGEYVLGAPQVPGATLRVGSPSSKSESGRGIVNIHSTTTTSDYNFFTVVAKKLSKENKYVKSVRLNGRPVTDWRIRHADIVRGGTLEFEMTNLMSAGVVADVDIQSAVQAVRNAKAADPTVNTAVVPVSRLEQDSYDWLFRHQRIMRERVEINPEVVFIGDSITHFWAGKASIGDMRDAETLPRWKKAFGSFRTLNLGFGWDRTGNVLKRLELGELDGLSPRIVVIHIGGNNFFNTENYAANTPREVADGILKIVESVHKRVPHAQLIVLSVMPFGELPGQLHRAPIRETNEILARELKLFDYVTPIDVTSRLLTADGHYPKALAADSIHPTDEGYRIIADALVPVIWQCMKLDRFGGQEESGHGLIGAALASREVTTRKGLGNFYAKCVPGATVRVAFFGGSITEADGWKTFTMENLRRRFPETKFELIDAALGGTGSDYGVYRLAKDVLPYRPDLMFVEFLVNDGDSNRLRAIEGYVRNFYKAFPESDIVFTYTLNKLTAPIFQRGLLPKGAEAFERVAERYGIPSMAMGLRAAEMANRGELVWNKGDTQVKALAGKETEKDRPEDESGPIVFLSDGAHPYRETGHRLYAEAVARGLDAIAAAKLPPVDRHTLPEPLESAMGTVRFYSPEAAQEAGLVLKGAGWRNDTTIQTSWWKDRPSFYKFYESSWRSGPGEASMTFRFKGASVLFAPLYGPGTGAAEITVDGKSRRVDFFDMYSAFWRMGPYLLCDGLDPNAVHEVTIRNLSGTCDREKVMREAGRGADYEKHKADFSVPQELMFCGLFVEGEIVK